MKTNLPTHISSRASEVKLHYKRPLFETMAHIACAEDAVYYLRETIDIDELDLRECFWVVLLTNANRVLTISEVSSGTTRSVLLNHKCIFQLTLLSNASAIILAHNHPSGNMQISKTDRKETKKIQTLAKILDVTVLDHIIITSESFVSFAQQNIL